MVKQISRYIIVAVLLLSGFGKVFVSDYSAEVLKEFNLFSDSINILIISVLPVIEIILGFMLLGRIKPKVTNMLVLILFLLFWLVSIGGYIMGFNQDCGCFGNLMESRFGIEMILRNLFFLLLSIYITRNEIVRPGRVKNITN